MKDFNPDNYCFVCGQANPIGLKLTFEYNNETDEMISQIKFAQHFQGWENVLHGGIISTVLDEVMVKAAAQKGIKCVTAELNVRFKKPAIMDQEFTLKGKITEIRRRLISAEASLIASDNISVASASGKFVQVG